MVVVVPVVLVVTVVGGDGGWRWWCLVMVVLLVVSDAVCGGNYYDTDTNRTQCPSKFIPHFLPLHSPSLETLMEFGSIWIFSPRELLPARPFMTSLSLGDAIAIWESTTTLPGLRGRGKECGFSALHLRPVILVRGEESDRSPE